MKIERVFVDSIHVGERLRPLNEGAVLRLVESMKTLGQLQPISVYAPDNTAAHLVAGRHRLEAARRLEWDDIEVVFVTGDEINRQMQEIAENLHRNELTALERDTQIARWVELVAAKVSDKMSETPPNKGGRPGKASATAREIGVNERDVQRAVKVASISDEAKTAARNAGLDDNRTALLEAATEKSPAAQVNIIKRIAASKQDTRKKKKKSRKARFAAPKSTPEQRDEFDLQVIQAFWETASDNARASFLKNVRSEPARGPAVICDRVREAIITLSGLPPAHEVAGWFAGSDAAIIISERLHPAAAWLADFSDAWKDDR
ncbi:ParB/RepB/Spo0J family partition protein [Bradyrhizobium sp. AZCC 2289]|uniref:ParB/RepB/Spo0J family partition protein n=1 Tax=Bradyrhizobium sp. AZCC 2289 TaxID=3117026 RepID=UPI002FF36897